MYNGPGMLPNTGMAAGPVALLFNGATTTAYILLGVSLMIAGALLMRTRMLRSQPTA